MVPLSALTKLQKASIAEAAILFRLCLLDVDVFSSTFDGSKFDFVVYLRKQDVMRKVQVKCVRESLHSQLPCIKLFCADGRNKLRRYRDGEFDVIVGYDYFTDTAYVYRPTDIANKKSMTTISGDAAERWDRLIE